MSIEAPMTGNADGTKASVLPAAKRFSKVQALRELVASFCDTTTLTSLCRVDKDSMCAAVQVLYQTVSNDRIRDILEAVVDDWRYSTYSSAVRLVDDFPLDGRGARLGIIKALALFPGLRAIRNKSQDLHLEWERFGRDIQDVIVNARNYHSISHVEDIWSKARDIVPGRYVFRLRVEMAYSGQPDDAHLFEKVVRDRPILFTEVSCGLDAKAEQLSWGPLLVGRQDSRRKTSPRINILLQTSDDPDREQRLQKVVRTVHSVAPLVQSLVFGESSHLGALPVGDFVALLWRIEDDIKDLAAIACYVAWPTIEHRYDIYRTVNGRAPARIGHWRAAYPAIRLSMELRREDVRAWNSARMSGLIWLRDLAVAVVEAAGFAARISIKIILPRSCREMAGAYGVMLEKVQTLEALANRTLDHQIQMILQSYRDRSPPGWKKGNANSVKDA